MGSESTERRVNADLARSDEEDQSQNSEQNQESGRIVEGEGEIVGQSGRVERSAGGVELRWARSVGAEGR